MKQTVDKLQIGLVLAISLIGGGAYRYAALEKQVQFNTDRYVAMDAKLDQILAMRTDIEVIKTKVQAMEKPVYHTRRDVKAIRKDVATLNSGPFAPLYFGPLTMRGR